MNWKSISLMAAIVGLVVLMTACSGVTLADLVQADVNQDVQEATQSPAKVSLSDAPFVREKYVNDFKTNLAHLDSEIADAQLFADFIGSLVNTGLQLSEGPLQGVPMGGVIFATLGGLAGLFIRKPGTQKEIDDAWDEAAAKTREALLDGAKSAKADS